MKKSTLNAIMQGVIVVLVIAIAVVSVKLILRPKEEADIQLTDSSVEPEVSEVEELPEPEKEVVIEDRVRIINDNINVRSGPGTDYERLGSAYTGYDFEFVEQLDEGWTKIMYDGNVAYVFSEYVEIIPMVKEEDGSYSEYVDLNKESEDSENAEDSEEPEDLSDSE